MELNTTATKAALKHGIGDVTDTLKCLLRLVISCFLQGGHLHCSQPDHKFSSVRISEVSQSSWRHGPSLSSTLVSHEAWKEVSWKQQRFSSLVRICQIPIIVKKTFKEKEELDHWKQTHHTCLVRPCAQKRHISSTSTTKMQVKPIYFYKSSCFRWGRHPALPEITKAARLSHSDQ